MKKKGKGFALLICLGLLLVFLCIACWQGLRIQYYIQETDKLSAPVRLAVLTDLHGSTYGAGQKELLQAIESHQPDLVLLVGDMWDDSGDSAATWDLLTGLAGAYPCYYVTGNHEWRLDDVQQLKSRIRDYGVVVLEGTVEMVEVKGQQLYIAGVDDPSAFQGMQSMQSSTALDSWQAQLDSCSAQLDGRHYSILLTHRPERIAQYQESGFDLLLAGHAHGGQVRIPGLINGLYAPNQGFFPAYAGGQYDLGLCTLIVSRGLCKNALPRVFNRPELLIVDIVPADS